MGLSTKNHNGISHIWSGFPQRTKPPFIASMPQPATFDEQHYPSICPWSTVHFPEVGNQLFLILYPIYHPYFIGFSRIKYPFCGTPIDGTPHIFLGRFSQPNRPLPGLSWRAPPVFFPGSKRYRPSWKYWNVLRNWMCFFKQLINMISIDSFYWI